MPGMLIVCSTRVAVAYAGSRSRCAEDENSSTQFSVLYIFYCTLIFIVCFLVLITTLVTFVETEGINLRTLGAMTVITNGMPYNWNLFIRQGFLSIY